MLEVVRKACYGVLKGENICYEDFDLMIASICLANDLILITNNTKHFDRIKELKIENWTN